MIGMGGDGDGGSYVAAFFLSNEMAKVLLTLDNIC